VVLLILQKNKNKKTKKNHNPKQKIKKNKEVFKKVSGERVSWDSSP
jgi:hypothetical protein